MIERAVVPGQVYQLVSSVYPWSKHNIGERVLRPPLRPVRIPAGTVVTVVSYPWPVNIGGMHLYDVVQVLAGELGMCVMLVRWFRGERRLL